MAHRPAGSARTTVTRRLVTTLAALVLATALPACSSPSPDGPLEKFLAGLAKADFTGVPLLDGAGQPLSAEAAKQQLVTAEGDLAGRTPGTRRVKKPVVRKSAATATVELGWPVADQVTWTYQTSVQLRRADKTWQVVLAPATLHPQLKAGESMTLKRSAAERGPILDVNGAPMVSSRPVVTVGIQPNQVKDLAALVRQLDKSFKDAGVEVDLTAVPGEVAKAKGDAFVEVATLRRDAYDKIRADIHDLPGAVFREGTLALAPSRNFARATLGTVGEVTKEIMDKNPGRYQVGDQVGLSGLQQRYDARLRGRPAVSVLVGGKDNAAARPLFNSDAQPGGPVRTSIDPAVQNAADAVLARQARRSAIVAIRVSDGAVVAASNGPNGGDLDLALGARVPPGSTFKTVTALGVLDNGSVTSEAAVNCPKTLTVEGSTYHNAHDFELGSVPFHTDFAKSCNTAFASLAPKLGPDGLAKYGAQLGIGVPWDAGVDAFSGKVSQGGSASEQAAAAFGQGQTVVSPVVMASAAAAVARGQFKQPRLVLDPAPSKTAPDGPQLKPEAVSQLKSMMREVVTTGTATGVRDKGEIYGKTGTAEYDNDPTHTHSWFMGWRGDLAFAVFVENGGDSNTGAVPLAGAFFTALG